MHVYFSCDRVESGHETTGLVTGWSLGMCTLWQGGVWARDYWTHDRVESGHVYLVTGWSLGMRLLDLLALNHNRAHWTGVGSERRQVFSNVASLPTQSHTVISLVKKFFTPSVWNAWSWGCMIVLLKTPRTSYIFKLTPGQRFMFMYQ